VTNTIADNVNGGQKSVSTTSNVATLRVNASAPVISSQITNSNIRIYAAGNSITLQNLPQNANVKVYNLTGQLISSKSLNQVNQDSDMLRIPVQTKGMYFVKVNNQIMRVAVK